MEVVKGVALKPLIQRILFVWDEELIYMGERVKTYSGNQTNLRACLEP